MTILQITFGILFCLAILFLVFLGIIRAAAKLIAKDIKLIAKEENKNAKS